MTGTNDLPRHDDPTEINPRPRPTPLATAAPNVTHLRRDIEAGATGDKLPMLDPAASPLGTDDEAGGVSPTTAEVAAARTAERGPESASRGVGGKTGPNPARVPLLIALAVILAGTALYFSFTTPWW